jgi:hypothetical protein
MMLSFDCVLDTGQLDTVYAVVRQAAFDRIWYIPIPNLGSDGGGEFYTEVTANGHTYRKEDPGNDCCQLVGVGRYNRVEKVLVQLIALYSQTEPVAFIVYFREHVPQAKIDAFTMQVLRYLRQNDLGAAGATGKQIGEHHSITIDVTRPITQVQHDELRNLISTSPIVYRFIENMVPSQVQTIDP